MNENIGTATNTLRDALTTESNYKKTENGAPALSSTLSPLLDLFGAIGAYRHRDLQELINLFISAFAADRLLALKMLFYARDVRGGLGERQTFRILIKYMANNYPDVFAPNVKLIPEFGRWDDVLALLDTPLRATALELISSQLSADLASDGHPSLLAKWLPSENTSSARTRSLARTLIDALGYTPRSYRRVLSRLRKEIRVVEAQMSQQDWDSIDYSILPSSAALRYRAAFLKHSPERYSAYLKELESASPERSVKINASTLFPYELVGRYLRIDGPFCSLPRFPDAPDPVIEAQWKALPDYLADSDMKNANFLVMADISGSMMSPDAIPVSTSVGLAIYFAEHAPRDSFFADRFITFSSEPRFVYLPPELSLLDKARLICVPEHVGYSTNLEAAFQLVLDAAVNNHVSQSQLPSAIVVISDMEIDDSVEPCSAFSPASAFITRPRPTTFTTTMRERFAAAGYEMPTLVYWNVNSRSNTFHGTKDDDSVRFVSGHSPAVFEGLCKHMGYSPLELMTKVLGAPRYSAITLGE